MQRQTPIHSKYWINVIWIQFQQFFEKPTSLSTNVPAVSCFVFLVTHVEIKLASTRVGGNNGKENGVAHRLMGLMWSGFILEV